MLHSSLLWSHPYCQGNFVIISKTVIANVPAIKVPVPVCVLAIQNALMDAHALTKARIATLVKIDMKKNALHAETLTNRIEIQNN